MLSYQNMEFFEDRIYMVTWDINRVYQYDYENNITTRVKGIEDGDRTIMAPFCGVVQYAPDKYFFAPLREKNIMLYDSRRESTRFVALKDMDVTSRFGEVIPYGDRLFLLPMESDAMVQFDLTKEEVTYHTECITALVQKYGVRDGELFHHGYALFGKELYLSSVRYKEAVLKIDLETASYEIIDLQKNTVAICGDETLNKCWLLSDRGAILEWDLAQGKTKEVVGTDSKLDLPFYEFIKHGKYVIALPWQDTNMIVYDTENETAESIVVAGNARNALVMFGKIFQDELYFFSHITRMLYRYDFHKKKIVETREIPEAVDDEVLYWEGNFGIEKPIYREINQDSLKQFLNSFTK